MKFKSFYGKVASIKFKISSKTMDINHTNYIFEINFKFHVGLT